MIYIIILFAELVILYFLSKRLTQDLFNFIYGLTKKRNLAIYILAVLFLPGTFIHEISHFLTALFLFVPVGEVEFLPEIQGSDSLKMGSVAIGKTDPIRKFLVGIAPFIIGTFLIIGSLSFLTLNNLLENPYFLILISYLVFSVGNTMFASKSDLKGAGELFVFLLFIYSLAVIFRIDSPGLNREIVLSTDAVFLIKTANLLLAVPLILDTAVIYLLKLFRVRIRI